MTLPHIKPSLQYKGTRARTQLLAVMSACMLFSSCCTPGVRPEDANLFQAMCGLSTGEFDDQLENDRNQVASSRETLEAEKSRSQDLTTDLETSKTELTTLLKEIDQMEQENRRMEAQISAMQTASAEAEQEQARLQGKLETIQDRLAALKQKAAVEQDAFEQYNAEKTRLKQEIEVLRMLISSQ